MAEAKKNLKRQFQKLIGNITLQDLADGPQINLQLDSKLDKSGGIVQNLVVNSAVADKILISDSNGALTHSSVGAATLDFLNGVTSAIQTQLTALSDSFSSGLRSFTLGNQFPPVINVTETIFLKRSGSDVVANDPNRWYINMYSEGSSQAGNILMPKIIDTNTYAVINPISTLTLNPELDGPSANQATGVNARFGIQLKKSGLYQASYFLTIKNESDPFTTNSARCVKIELNVLSGASSGTETDIDGSKQISATLEDDAMEFCTLSATCFFMIRDSTIANDNVFLRLYCMTSKQNSDSFSNIGVQNNNGLLLQSGTLLVQRIGDVPPLCTGPFCLA